MSGAASELPILSFSSRDEWEAWLGEHHESSGPVYVKIAKKGSGIESITQPQAVEGALCWGWIDSQGRRLDDEYWLQRFSRRTARSKWSKINTERASKLIDEGTMQPPGLREVERAKADGRWDAAYDSPRTATVPDDLRQALDRDPAAGAFFAELDGANRYAILYRIQDAKRPETRARRIAKFVAMLSEGKKIHP
jgi:uncharacterized protein YdeI (YjbR/CyaY-like superfamily)